jgi:hypothetical protein
MSLQSSILAAFPSRNIPRLLRILAPIVMIPAGLAVASAQTQSLIVALPPAVSITAPASFALTSGGTTFGIFTSPSVGIQFKVRNTQGSGTGSITVKSTEFSPLNGPMIASGNVTYLCSAPTVGVCSGAQTLSTTSATPIVTFPASTCTGTGCGTGATLPTVQVLFTLANSAQYKTGTYTATLTFTISAT